jgi:hypothetical protein
MLFSTRGVPNRKLSPIARVVYLLPGRGGSALDMLAPSILDRTGRSRFAG